MVSALNDPIAVFSYGNKAKALNAIVEITHGGSNFLVGVHFNRPNQNNIEVSDIRTLFPKQSSEWLNWIQQGKATYLNKKNLLDLVAQQRTTLAEVSYLDPEGLINIMNGFENPNIASEQSTQQQKTLADVGDSAPNVAGEIGGGFDPADPTRAKIKLGRPGAGAANNAESGTATQQRTNLADVDSRTPDSPYNLANDADNVNSERALIIQQAKKNGTWMKAPNGRHSNLDKNQYNLVRSETFKRKFGDWESLATRNLIEHGSPIKVLRSPIASAPTINEAVKRAREEYRKLQETEAQTIDGRKVRFSGKGFRKTANHAADDRVLLIIPQLPEILSKAYPIFSSPNTDSDKNIKAYHSYGIKADFGSSIAVIRIIIREEVSGEFYYDNDATDITKINKGTPSSAASPRQSRSDTLDSAPLKEKLTNWWHKVNPNEVTVPLDENSEPNFLTRKSNKKTVNGSNL